MKKLVTFLCCMTTLMADPFAPPPIPPMELVESNVVSYATVGISALGPIPYIANVGLGMRFTEDHSFVGVDGSFNYTTNYSYNNLFAKLFLPVYFSPSKAKSSVYIGPYITVGKDFPKIYPYSGSIIEVEAPPECEGGLIFGKNMGDKKITSFWQISARGVVFVLQRGGSYHPQPLPLLWRFDWGFTF